MRIDLFSVGMIVLGLALPFGVADAQFRLPSRLPDLPDVLPDTPLDRPERILDRLENRALGEIRSARRDALETLLGDNADLLERGPRGAVVLRGEVLVVDPGAGLLALAQQTGFSVIEDRTEAALGLRYVRLRAPGGTGVQAAIAILSAIDPNGIFDVNAIYMPSGLSHSAQYQSAPPGYSNISIGMIDAGVPAHSPVFASGQVETRHFRGSSVVPHNHGYHVAAILGSGDGVVPGARIFAADVYGGQATGGSADTLIQALGWMAEADVRVVNISIVGPRNRALQAAVRRFTDQDRMIVAAVGNDGADAEPLYPAAYDGVVGVGGVNADRTIMPESVQGDQVDFSARGMDMVWPALDGRTTQVRGTSFAAPIVAGLLAQELAASGSGDSALRALSSDAHDLGDRGRDPAYGEGLVGDHLFQNASTRLSGN